MEIGEIVWNIVIRWEYFEKKTLGVQLVDAADSIAFNISEGYGRFHYKENKNFCTVADLQKKPLQESGRPKPETLFLMKNLICSMKNLIFISGWYLVILTLLVQKSAFDPFDHSTCLTDMTHLTHLIIFAYV